MGIVTRNNLEYARQFLNGARDRLDKALRELEEGNLASAKRDTNLATYYSKQAACSVDFELQSILREAEKAQS